MQNNKLRTLWNSIFGRVVSLLDVDDIAVWTTSRRWGSAETTSGFVFMRNKKVDYNTT